jgi:hypothetical protein
MNAEFEREKEKILFALKNIQEVAERRKNISTIHFLGSLSNLLKDIEAKRNGMQAIEVVPKHIKELKTAALFLCSDLRIPIKFEIKEIITPIIEVKRGVHEFSSQMWGDYLQWLPEEELSPEAILGMLEDDLYKLNIAEEILKS